MKIVFLLLTVMLGTADAREYGEASYYHDKFHGRQTASGETFDQRKMTAAHKTQPFGTKMLVKLIETNQSVIVRINDRGPFIRGRIIDLSRAAADKLGIISDGTAEVYIEVIQKF